MSLRKPKRKCGDSKQGIDILLDEDEAESDGGYVETGGDDEEEYIVIGVEKIRWNEATWSMEQFVRWKGYSKGSWHPQSDVKSYPTKYGARNVQIFVLISF